MAARDEENPFSLPQNTSELLSMRETLKAEESEMKRAMRGLSLSQRVQVQNQQMKRHRRVEPDKADETAVEQLNATQTARDPKLEQLAVATRDRRVEQDQLAEYVSQKRDMFFVRYSLGVKKAEMEKLQRMAEEEERLLEQAERALEEDAAKFDKFLRENDRTATESLEEAEKVEAQRKEKALGIKKLEAEIMAVQGDLTKQEDSMEDLVAFRSFLWKLAPQDWKNSHPSTEPTPAKPQIAESRSAKTLPIDRLKSKSRLLSPSASDASLLPRSAKRSRAASAAASKQGMALYIQKDPPELPFSSPSELLDIYRQLEEENLTLIQNGQEIEEALQELQAKAESDEQQLEKESKYLEKQISALSKDIEKHNDATEELKAKCNFFSSATGDDQDQELATISKKVETVYSNCIGENDAGISTLQMLTNIENLLEELFEKMQNMPPDVLMAAEKAKDKERRQRIREEKLAAQKKHQEERMRRALERAQMEPKKMVGKRVMYRSEPPPKQKASLQKRREKQAKEEEDLAYYFS